MTRKWIRPIVAGFRPIGILACLLVAQPAPAQESQGLQVTLASPRTSHYRSQPIELLVTFANEGDAPTPPLDRARILGERSFVCARGDMPTEREGYWAHLVGEPPRGVVGPLLPGETFIGRVLIQVPKEVLEQSLTVSIQWVGSIEGMEDLRSPELRLSIRDARHPLAIFDTSSGSFVVELFEKKAPNTVANFIALARKGFYDGLKFHRVFPNYVVQTGSPDGSPTGGPGYTIKGEINDAPFKKGTVGMATVDGNPDSGGSQFFICVADLDQLNGKYTAFGRVIEGQPSVDGISRVPTDGKGKPLKDVTIKSVTLVMPQGYEPPPVEKGGSSTKSSAGPEKEDGRESEAASRPSDGKTGGKKDGR